jgi:hypothetical protein
LRALIILALIAVVVSLGFAFTRANNTPLASSNVYCGVERAAVKHLTDGFVLPVNPVYKTPDQLLALTPPHVGPDSPRIISNPGSLPETLKVQLTHVHVVAVKQESDSDLHIIIRSAQGELNVESPMAYCDRASPYRQRLAVARAAVERAFPNVSTGSYTVVDRYATIRGVLFWDVLHGQRGAPNGVELHPVTMLQVTP